MYGYRFRKSFLKLWFFILFLKKWIIIVNKVKVIGEFIFSFFLILLNNNLICLVIVIYDFEFMKEWMNI